MKKIFLFMSVLASLFMVGCSQEEITPKDDGKGENDGRFLAVEIISPSTATTRDASTPPTNGDFEDGTESPDENQVNSLRFYFFNDEGDPITLGGTNYNYVDVLEKDIKKEENNTEKPNVEQKLKAVIVVNPTNNGNVRSMVAVANFEAAELKDKTSYSRNELANIAKDFSAVEKSGKAHFMMTSATYANEKGQISRALIDPSKHLCTTEEAALANPVEVYIERVVAKVRVKTAWRKTDVEGKIKMEVLENVTYNGKTYTAIKAKDSDGNDIKNGENDVYILFTGWDVTGKADKSYFIKKVNSTINWSALTSLWFWNHPAYHRSYWGVNPSGISLQYDTYNSIKDIETKSIYCQENAADNLADGTKSSYTPSTETSNRTQVIIAAVLVTVNDVNVATPISWAKWGYEDYTEEGVKKAMLAFTERNIFYETDPEIITMPDNSKKERRKFVSIIPNHVKLVTAQEAGKANDKSEDSERYLSYLKLADGEGESAHNVQFYSSDVTSATNSDGTLDVDKLNAAKLTNKQVNDILCNMPGAKIWHEGLTYYYTDIRHLGALYTNNSGYGYYGVVRNHIYDITIEAVTGLGTPVLDPTEVIIPQKPSQDKDIYVAARVNILSWRIVKNAVDLTW